MEWANVLSYTINVVTLPIFLFISLTYLWSGYIFIKENKKVKSLASGIVGLSMIFGGIH